MNSIKKYFVDLFKGVISLVKGMSVTGHYFVHPGEIITEQYPNNRNTLKMFDRFKGEVIMVHNENNEHHCTGCGICAMNCPNGSIEVISKTIEVDGKKKKVIDKHIYHHGMCTFCGLCIKTCPQHALAFAQTFENSVYDRSRLNKILNHPGSSLIKEKEA
ncbi:MAG: 4Fe-4S binding protein [Bacteroidota bacterium]|nr:4Fe-4S binding protein [Bacteroidota bacterium]MDP4226235.1 4Fe-4S binding protein [Bacteroidota bacterium]